ncbi:hypothetical protein [Streptomyces sp. MST-110588]|uniref:tetratricopeptide repeat protein n=1 Tax=Streptomyces sp. MST-110588 TaxID=2833628 RepID=UPI001F5D376C|nr:hypothetical protein [Streptomyces sp. MST-110588]UNO43414.1 hypothetical protein KGS77_32950 [Streptomyces sp. MST-110588]
MGSTHTLRRALAVVALALSLSTLAWVTGFRFPGVRDDQGPRTPVLRGDTDGSVVLPLTGEGLGRRLDTLRRHLRAQPRDAANWAALGSACVEQARRTADPGLYGQAQRAFARSLALSPAPGNSGALAGQAALAAARHDFFAALRLADRSLAVSPYGELALAVRVDALVELGRYDAAHRAALRADARRPGIPAFTRFAYVAELRGERATARRVLEQALAPTSAPGDIAHLATALGELSRSEGKPGPALRSYAVALRADPGHVPALLGRGQVRAAVGDLAGAVRDLEAVVARQPLPAHLALLGEMYAARGERRAAARQYAALDAWTRLARAQRVNTDLDTALVAADHGERAQALRAARAEWKRRHTVHTADALAWALHRRGRDAAALPLARQATETLTRGGYRNAAFLYHRAEIEHALGRDAEARTHGRDALALGTALTPQARTALGRWVTAGEQG